ncbi:BamA/TamA family outer membrane protein [candidate division GN15 bacterium]|nr:BamA/TamA family outer membrane protein [candidate division GN15 bacterium]
MSRDLICFSSVLVAVAIGPSHACTGGKVLAHGRHLQVKTPPALVVLILALALIGASAVGAERIVIGGLDGIDPVDNGREYSVLLALSGGGARGLSAIGVLRAFEEKQLAIRGIAGTSMGGIVGGLYASGYTPDELAEMVDDISFADLFSNAPARSTMFFTRRADRDRHLLTIRFDGIRPYIPQGLTAGQKLTALFSELTTKANYLAGGDFSEFPIPFMTVSTDIVDGELVRLTEGSLADAMRATMAFPLAFTAVENDNQLLMDGGMLAPIPVEQVCELVDSIGYVVAVNTTSPLLPRDELVTPVDIANQVTSIMTADQLEKQLGRADYIINPPIASFTAADFDQKDSLIELGYRAGLRAADSIIADLEQRRQLTRYAVREVRVGRIARNEADRVHAELHGRTFTHPELVHELKRQFAVIQPYQLTASLEPVDSTGANGVVPISLSLAVQPALQRDSLTLLFKNNVIYDDSSLAEAMDLPDGAVSAADLQAGADRIVTRYRDRGYDFAEVRDMSVDRATGTVTVSMDEAIIRRVDVEGNTRSRDWLIRSYFPLSRGEPFSTEKAARGIANIYGTDLYDRVGIDLVPYRDGAIVKIYVVEKKYTQLRFGWHWVDDYQSEQFLELRDDNLLGIGLESVAHARFGEDRWEYYLKSKLDRIFFTYLTTDIRLFYKRTDRSLYNDESQELGERQEERWGGEVSFGQQIARLGTVTAGLVIEEMEWRDRVENTSARLGLRSIRLESQVENLDRVPFPTSGNRHRFQVQLTGRVFGGDVDYTRWYASLETFLTIDDVLTYHPRLQVGISRTGLPPPEKFYMGGARSFSGYHTHELSGDKMILLNQEIRVRLPLNLYLYGRFDLGEVYTSTTQIKPSNLRHGFGAALAYDSFIGPIEFGYGRSEEETDQFYFNAGLDF